MGRNDRQDIILRLLRQHKQQRTFLTQDSDIWHFRHRLQSNDQDKKMSLRVSATQQTLSS